MTEETENIKRKETDETAYTQTRNPYLFVVGSPRSGTTLLKRMINAHSDIAITRETHWIPRYYNNSIGLTRDGMVTPELIPKLFEYHRFPHLKIKRKVLEDFVQENKSLSYAQFVSHVFDLYGREKKKSFVGDKTPSYVRKIPLLHSLWPKCKFVHIIRDGRDVCLSMLKWRMSDRVAARFPTWDEDAVSTLAFWWKWHVGLGVEDGKALGTDLYHEIHYESLIKNPADESRKLCTFLELPFDDAMLNYHEGRTKTKTGLSANSAWLPPTSGLRDWSSQMAGDDVKRFEAATGGFLGTLGYRRSISNLSSDDVDHAARIRRLFQANRFPQCW